MEGVGGGCVVGEIVLGKVIKRAEEPCGSSWTGGVAAGVNANGGADRLVGKVKGMLVIVVVEVL